MFLTRRAEIVCNNRRDHMSRCLIYLPHQAREFIEEEKRRMSMDSRFDTWSKAEINVESRRRYEAAQATLIDIDHCRRMHIDHCIMMPPAVRSRARDARVRYASVGAARFGAGDARRPSRSPARGREPRRHRPPLRDARDARPRPRGASRRARGGTGTRGASRRRAGGSRAPSPSQVKTWPRWRALENSAPTRFPRSSRVDHESCHESHSGRNHDSMRLAQKRNELRRHTPLKPSRDA